MATLYELTDQFKQLLTLAGDPEVDPEVFADTLEGLQGEIEVKADGYARVIRQLEADAVTLRIEEERLAKRRRSVETNIDRMKSTLQLAMQTTGKKKIPLELFTVSIQKNPASVVMDEQYIENLPDEYLIPQEPKINKKQIKEDIKAGINLDGIAHLEQTESLRIR